jgi:predicted transcriptional regulator
MHSEPNNQDRHPDIRQVAPDGSLSTAGILVSDVSPRITEWVPGLLDELLPSSVRTLREYIAHTDPGILSDGRYGSLVGKMQADTLGVTHREWGSTTDTWSDDEAEAVEYLHSLFNRAVKYHDQSTDELSNYHQQREKNIDTALTKIGTGKGPLNGGLEALAKGPVALHSEFDEAPQPITLILDGQSWTDLDDRSTGVRALAAIAVLGSAFDVRLVISPGLDQHLRRRYSTWYDTHLGLTESADRSTQETVATAGRSSATTRRRAWEVLQELPEDSGRLRLLGNLPVDGSRDYRDLKQDDEIGVTPGTVGRYVLDLEELGLVSIDRSGQYNSASLTSLGQLAVEEFLTADYRTVHPSQSTLQTALTLTPQSDAGTVYRAQARTGGGEGSLPTATAEEWMAATGSPANGDSYVQWLNGPSEILDAWGMHRRYRANRRNRGVNLVDDRLAKFDDGRISYLSCFDDDLLVMSQWGGPLPTLGRIAGALLSDKALSKILTPSALGSEFEAIDDGVVDKLDQKVGDIIRWGHQIGWFSEDEEQYDDWRERIGTVRSLCLEKVGELTNSDDIEARKELFRDLQGLIASATQLYYAIGVDVTINIRMPDTGMLIRDEKRLNDFLDFARYTVPKQSVYGIHSGYRMLLEDREEKLKKRLPYDVDSSDPAMHLTASWVFSGPTMTDLKPQIEQAIEREASEIREAIADGTEAAPVMEIPVQISNTYTATRELVEEFATAKGYEVSHRGDIHERNDDLERLVRLFLRVLGTADRPHRACPSDVAEAMLHIARSTQSFDFISIRDIAYGLSQLPAERLLPDLPPTATKLLKTLLDADEPMRRSKIIEAAGISGSSYDRYINELAAWDIIEPTESEGRRRWEGHLETWWSPQSHREEPFGEPEPDTAIIDAEFARDVGSRVLCHYITHYDLPELEEVYMSGLCPIAPDDDIEALFGRHRRLSRWWAFLWGAYADEDEIANAEAVTGSETAVRIGQLPGSVEDSQQSLGECKSVST